MLRQRLITMREQPTESVNGAAPAGEEAHKPRVSGGSNVILYDSAGLQRQSVLHWAARHGLRLKQSPQGGGGGGVVIAGPLVIEGSGSGAGAVAEYGTRVGYGSGSGLLGWIVYETDTLRVFPLVGGGGSGIAITPAGDAVDAKPIAQAEAGLFQVGLGVDLMLRLGKISLALGLRMGVQLAAASGDSVPGARSGLFLRIVAGPRF